ncbi:unnamed protein product, partial [Tetraodon nigroviridis]
APLPQDSVMNACHRGCRLYSICQFVNGNAGFNTSKEECQGACQEAYVKLLEQEACSSGCASQPSEPELKRRKLRAMTLRPKPPSVMEAVSSWCSDIVSSAQSFISSTWTFYLQADDGKVVVFQGEKQIDQFPDKTKAGEIYQSKTIDSLGLKRNLSQALLRASQRWSTLRQSCRPLGPAWRTSPGPRSTLTPKGPTGPGATERERQVKQAGRASTPSSTWRTPRPSTTSWAACPGETDAFERLTAANPRLTAPSWPPQALRPPPLDPGRLPLPVHHGHAVAELRQPGHRPGAAHQDAGEGTEDGGRREREGPRWEERQPRRLSSPTRSSLCLFPSPAEHQRGQRLPG